MLSYKVNQNNEFTNVLTVDMVTQPVIIEPTYDSSNIMRSRYELFKLTCNRLEEGLSKFEKKPLEKKETIEIFNFINDIRYLKFVEYKKNTKQNV